MESNLNDKSANLNEQVKIAMNETTNTTATTATSSTYNQISEKMIDVADLEYDEEFSALVADDETKLGMGQLIAESLLDEDYEAELGAVNALNDIPSSSIQTEQEKRYNDLKERIDRFGIVNVCGMDSAGRPIIILSACKLPETEEILKEKEFFASHQHFYDLLLEVLSGILERYVESEYTLVYFHYGLKSSTQPSFNWLGRVYKMLDRKFKKNLKALYVVHPTTLFKLLWHFIKPLISSKFNKKVTYCNSLQELGAFIDLKVLTIPDEVKMLFYHYEYESIAENNNGDCIPLCIKETVIFLRKNLKEEGLFRKSGSFERIKQIQHLYNQGEPVAYDQYEYHVAACILKAFLRELPESLLPGVIFNEIVSLQALDTVDKVDVARDLLYKKLPKNNYKFLRYLIDFLSQVSSNSAENKMDARNLSYVFGPNFLRFGPESNEVGLIHIEKINSFVELLIKYNAEIFPKEYPESN